MKALILAAGCGRRLWPLTAQVPKCLLELDCATILEHLLDGLRQTQVGEVVLVCGHGVDRVRQRLSTAQTGPPVRVVFNPFYAMSDNLVSLWTARSELQGDLMLLNGDAVFHPQIFELLDSASWPISVLVARKSEYTADDMKVSLDDNRIAAIGKDLETQNADAAAIGGLRVTGAGSARLRQALDQAIGEPRALASHFPALLQRVAEEGEPAVAVDVGSLPWADVDTPEDLRSVREGVEQYRRHTPAAPRGGKA
jgi:L-glutamine-phosphate cytidylyltransferase